MAKVITLDELRSHTQKENIWLLLHSKVYDVSKFIDEHPGGDEVMLAEAGRDATEAFEDVGHSDEARALLPDMLVGEIEATQEAKKSTAAPIASPAQSTATSSSNERSNLLFLGPIGILFAYFAWRYYSGTYASAA